jgi:putative membrane protein
MSPIRNERRSEKRRPDITEQYPMMRKMTIAAGLLAATLAFAPGPGETQIPAQRGIRTETRNAVPLQGRIAVRGESRGYGGQAAGANDSLFAAAAGVGGLAELTISQLGNDRAADPELKRFSQLMLEEHLRMNAELKTLADRKGIVVPRVVDQRALFCAESLSHLTGVEFDRCYARAQLILHMDSVAAYEAAAKQGMDGDVRALALRGLPRIKEHLKLIKPIATKYEDQNEKEHAKIRIHQPSQY